MSTKTPKTSRILAAVHETARDLHAAGLVSKRRMKDYDSLCLVPVPESSSETIRALRDRGSPPLSLNGSGTSDRSLLDLWLRPQRIIW